MSHRKIIPCFKNLAHSRCLPHYINGKFVRSTGSSIQPVLNPASNTVIDWITTDDDVACDKALTSSQLAFQDWSKVSLNVRLEKLIQWYTWLGDNKENLATIISEENGKPMSDARAELDRGYEVVKYAFSAPSLLKGDHSIINSNLEVHSKKEPLGVTTGIMPFNFPAMIPLWMIPISLITGNSIIIKTSEKCPVTPLYLAYGASLSGIPDGLINVLHGDKDVTTKLITHSSVKGVSFVGSTTVGKKIYAAATEHGKRTQINMGAKNHAVVMPDCNYLDAANSIISAFVMGQRCMAISVLVVVDGAEPIIDSIVEKLGEVDVVRDIGPLITEEARQNVIDCVAHSVGEGGTIKYGDYNKTINGGIGNYMEPIVIDHVDTTMKVYREELFAPVLSIIRVPDIDAAIKLVNSNEYGNGTSIFTTSNYNAKHYENNTNVTQCGINVPIPASPPYYSWTSGKESYRGSHYIYGSSSFDFYTQQKTVMSKHVLNSELSVEMPTNQ